MLMMLLTAFLWSLAGVFIKLIEMLKERDIFDLEMLNEKGKPSSACEALRPH